MLRIGKLTDYATVVLAVMARDPGQCASASQLAMTARLELPTVSKLLKQLAGAGLVKSQRGTRGGYQLARPAPEIRVLDIVTALEGPVGMTECAQHRHTCQHETHCRVQAEWRRISHRIREELRAVRLSDLLPAARTRTSTKTAANSSAVDANRSRPA
jgi:FeS assembly SUF system regulator